MGSTATVYICKPGYKWIHVDLCRSMWIHEIPGSAQTPRAPVQYKQPPPPIPKGKTHAPPTGPT